MTSVGEFANNPGAGSYDVAPPLSPIVPRHKQRLLRKGGGRVSGLCPCGWHCSVCPDACVWLRQLEPNLEYKSDSDDDTLLPPTSLFGGTAPRFKCVA